MADFTDVVFFESGGGISLSYINSAYDSTASKTVRWTTTTGPDIAGGSYPGPGSFNAASYSLVDIIGGV